MIIYGALFVPVITAVLLFCFFRQKTAWWEYIAPIFICAAFIFTAKACVEKSQVTSTEYWGSIVERIEYYEDWDEWITQTCSRKCCCDSKGNNCQTTYYDCSYRQYHSAYWQIITTTGETISISQSQYQKIKNKLGNESFVELNRNYYHDDGDMYVCKWNCQNYTAVPVTSQHSYENRIKAADQSVFHFGKITSEDIKKYTLKDYPPIYTYEMASVVGLSGKDADTANIRLGYLNGILGPKKQVKVIVLVFMNQPLDAALYQEWYWQGGNKNEFVICIGIDKSGSIKWCKPFAWNNERLKITIRQYVQDQKRLNLTALSDHLYTQLATQWKRKQFKEFSYLTVEPPMGWVITCYIVAILICTLSSLWIIKNEYE